MSNMMTVARMLDERM